MVGRRMTEAAGRDMHGVWPAAGGPKAGAAGGKRGLTQAHDMRADRSPQSLRAPLALRALLLLALAGGALGSAGAADVATRARKPAPVAAEATPERGADVLSTLPGASSHQPGEQVLSTTNQRNAGRDRLVGELERRRELDDLVNRPQSQPPIAVIVDPRDRHRSRERADSNAGAKR